MTEAPAQTASNLSDNPRPDEITEAAALPPRLWEPRPYVGEMGFAIEQRDGRSFAKRQTHKGMSRVVRPHYLDDSGQVYYTMINPGGGFFGGDDYRIDVAVGEDASFLLTDQSATTVYKTPDDYCMQEVNIALAPGAVLEFLPSQLIAYTNATYKQFLRVDMAPTSTLVFADIITPGWAADGTQFTFDEVHVRSAINVDGKPAILDNLRVRPGTGMLTKDSLLFLEDKTHLGTLTAVDRRIDDDTVKAVREEMAVRAADTATEVRWAVSASDAPGLSVRAIGTHTDDIRHVLYAAADLLRAEHRSQGPVRLRKQ